MTQRSLAIALGAVTEIETDARAQMVDADEDERYAAVEVARRATALRLALERWLLRRATHAALHT